jgi:RNA polymerase sigma-70 factor (ECF subfamily)
MTSLSRNTVLPGKHANDERGDYFVSTRWTVVLSAGRKSSPQSDQALAELCRTYWYPLYAFVRRRVHSKEDAEDLTQAFFARFLERNYLEGLSSERGKFRAFLLSCLKHFLANEWDKATRQKRGGGVQHLSLDWQTADERFHMEPADTSSPDQLFDRDWATALLEKVIARLQDEHVRAGKSELFEHGRSGLMAGESRVPHAEIARRLGIEEGAWRVALHRMRKRFRELLREEIAQTLADGAMLEEELRSLQAALRH